MPTALIATRPQPKTAAMDLELMSSPATAVPLNAHLKSLHQKASRALILDQGATAWVHCRDAIQHCNVEQLTCEYGEQQARQLCCRLWILYICVLSSLTEIAAEDGKLKPKHGLEIAAGPKMAGFPASVREVWDSIMTAFGGYAGNVDSEVLVPTVLLCLKLRDAKTARDIVEAWLATLSDETMYLLQGHVGSDSDGLNGATRRQQRTMVQASYMRVCELYTLHILPQLDDFASAYEFLNMSSVVSAPAKDEYKKRLDSLRSPATPKKSRSSASRSKTQSKKKGQNKPKQQAGMTSGAVPAIDGSTSLTSEGSVKVAKESGRPVDGLSALHNQQLASQKSNTLPANISDAAPVLYTPNAAPKAAGMSSRQGTRTRALTRRPRSTVAIAWQVVRRLMSRWGLTVFTLAVIVAVLRMVTQRFRLSPLLGIISRRLWSTFRMGTQVTYI
ncbi:hypothetical protein GGI15_001926 [Coemansia interrupta]|uniref:Uncharacterized protein n=1 Tax=Coemansia interrupta TaxID=1126814 RepID=A0A9W8LLZ3_9FUNG|nr:hypothetical protein GGI15_001926 [Coemansia interrupta]